MLVPTYCWWRNQKGLCAVCKPAQSWPGQILGKSVLIVVLAAGLLTHFFPCCAFAICSFSNVSATPEGSSFKHLVSSWTVLFFLNKNCSKGTIAHIHTLLLAKTACIDKVQTFLKIIHSCFTIITRLPCNELSYMVNTSLIATRLPCNELSYIVDTGWIAIRLPCNELSNIVDTSLIATRLPCNELSYIVDTNLIATRLPCNELSYIVDTGLIGIFSPSSCSCNLPWQSVSVLLLLHQTCVQWKSWTCNVWRKLVCTCSSEYNFTMTSIVCNVHHRHTLHERNLFEYIWV